MQDMTSETIIRRFHELAGFEPKDGLDADSLIGIFQTFRPDGAGLAGLFSQFDVGDALHERLDRLFAASGDDRRPNGGRDAYFVVRNPQPLDPDLAARLGRSWIEGLHQLADSLGATALAARLSPTPRMRILEGLPPKHPKSDAEKSRLLRAIRNEASQLVLKIDAGPYPPILRPAYYFTACDSMLRDYLMWPLYAGPSGVRDPLEPYFELWRHGVKYRIFGETQVDLYLPRQQI